MGNLMRGGRGDWGVVVRLAGRRGTLANVQLHVVTINGGIDNSRWLGAFQNESAAGRARMVFPAAP